MKARKGRPLWGLARAKVELPLVFFYCSLFFLAGFYGSLLFSPRFSGVPVPRGRLLEVETEASDLPGMRHGETGESRPSSVTFQVLSWKPRAVYFPKFATEEECRNVIKIARPGLVPSQLALREGETEENTRGIRTRYLKSSCRVQYCWQVSNEVLDPEELLFAFQFGRFWSENECRSEFRCGYREVDLFKKFRRGNA